MKSGIVGEILKFKIFKMDAVEVVFFNISLLVIDILMLDVCIYETAMAIHI